MNKTIVLALCLLCATVLQTSAAESTAKRHWYSITARVGNQTETFTGSSSFDADELGHHIITGEYTIELRDLRYGGMFVDAKTFEWRTYPGRESLHILPSNIVYFIKLSEDPLEKQTRERR